MEYTIINKSRSVNNLNNLYNNCFNLVCRGLGDCINDCMNKMFILNFLRNLSIIKDFYFMRIEVKNNKICSHILFIELKRRCY
jgi:hypothetical protein